MNGQIFVCEYDGTLDEDILQEQAVDLPLRLPQDWRGRSRRSQARQRILAWLLLGHAVKERFGFTLQQLNIRRDENGKPFSGIHPEIQFNISHCDTACACIVGLFPAGVDVERKFRCKDGLLKKVCHPKEYEQLMRMDETAREKQFRFLWSLKESFVKMDGRGLGYGMDRLSFAALLPVRLPPRTAFQGACGSGSLLLLDHEKYTLAAYESTEPVQAEGPLRCGEHRVGAEDEAEMADRAEIADKAEITDEAEIADKAETDPYVCRPPDEGFDWLPAEVCFVKEAELL